MTAIRNAMSNEDLESAGEDAAPETGRWSHDQQLLAGIDDRLARLEYVLVAVNSDGKGKKPTPPKPMRRPGVSGEEKKPRTKLNEQSAERLFQLINGSAA